MNSQEHGGNRRAFHQQLLTLTWQWENGSRRRTTNERNRTKHCDLKRDARKFNHGVNQSAAIARGGNLPVVAGGRRGLDGAVPSATRLRQALRGEPVQLLWRSFSGGCVSCEEARGQARGRRRPAPSTPLFIGGGMVTGAFGAVNTHASWIACGAPTL